MPDQLCDLELLLNGAYSPLSRFMTKAECDGVITRMRLPDGTPWPLPITLTIPGALAERLTLGGWLALRDAEGIMIAALDVRDLWQAPDNATVALSAPEGARDGGATWLVGGPVEGLRLPIHHDFTAVRLSPADVRRDLRRLGWRRIVAFQTTRPIHRAEHAATVEAARRAGAGLLLHVIAGKGSSAEVDHFSLVRCCSAAIGHYPQNMARLALLPLAARRHEGRESLLRAIVARNYGCTHLLLEAGATAPGPLDGLGVEIVTAAPFVYVESRAAWAPAASVPHGEPTLHLGDDELADRLATGREVPPWFTFPEVLAELKRAYPPRHRQGFTIFFTGLSGSGKSTIAGVLVTKFMEIGGRPVTLLDGDIVRKHLSSELGFSKEHRDINIRRIGFVAAEITKNGGIAICAPIAPYDAVRKQVRAMVERVGGFVLVHVATPLAVCEGRDRKGLYAKARAGLIPQFTGVSDPYEGPDDAEIVVDTTEITPESAAEQVVRFLGRSGHIVANGS
jgi:sulfate adenylyltransferase